MHVLRIPYPEAPPFDPAQLFSSNEAGAWYDPSDLATLWKDTAATDPVTAAGDAVARIDDKSGNGNHLMQSSAETRPTYQTDSAGNAYLSFDGSDDTLNVALALGYPFDRISAIQQIGWSLGRRILAHGPSLLLQRLGSPQITIHDGINDVVRTSDLAVGTNGIVTERHVANAQQIAINNGQYVTGDAGASTPGATFSIGADPAGASASNIRCYGLLIRSGSLTDGEVSRVRAWLADKAGVAI